MPKNCKIFLKQWYEENKNTNYNIKFAKKYLADETGIPIEKVEKWLYNKRSRQTKKKISVTDENLDV